MCLEAINVVSGNRASPAEVTLCTNTTDLRALSVLKPSMQFPGNRASPAEVTLFPVCVKTCFKKIRAPSKLLQKYESPCFKKQNRKINILINILFILHVLKIDMNIRCNHTTNNEDRHVLCTKTTDLRALSVLKPSVYFPGNRASPAEVTLS